VGAYCGLGAGGGGEGVVQDHEADLGGEGGVGEGGFFWWWCGLGLFGW
jgi:hypothetical protein